MCKKNITTPFKFFCYTDDASNLIKEVHPVPFVDHGLEIIVHNKLFLFSEEFDQYLDPGPRLYFDLDLIIKSNVDDIVTSCKDELTLIRASWRPDLPYGKYCPGCPDRVGYSHHHQFNSSCMTWQSPHTRSLWDLFIKNTDYYTLAYPLGMDSFLWYEHTNANTNVHLFPERMFWSHHYGVDYFERMALLKKNPDADYFQYENNNKAAVDAIPIVLLNGPNTKDYYKQYRNYYAD